MHPYVIDSSLVYNITGKRNQRSALKLLSEIFLGERIQTGGSRGHDPTEDALATLKLIQCKLKNGEVQNDADLVMLDVPTLNYSSRSSFCFFFLLG